MNNELLAYAIGFILGWITGEIIWKVIRVFLK